MVVLLRKSYPQTVHLFEVDPQIVTLFEVHPQMVVFVYIYMYDPQYRLGPVPVCAAESVTQHIVYR